MQAGKREPGRSAVVSGASGRKAGGPTYPNRPERDYRAECQAGQRGGRSGICCGTGPTRRRSKRSEACPETDEHESSAVLLGARRPRSPPCQDNAPGDDHTDRTEQPKASRHHAPLCPRHCTARLCGDEMGPL